MPVLPVCAIASGPALSGTARAQTPCSGRPLPVTSPEMLPLLARTALAESAWCAEAVSEARSRCQIESGAGLLICPARTITLAGAEIQYALISAGLEGRETLAQAPTRIRYWPGRRPPSRYRPSDPVLALA